MSKTGALMGAVVADAATLGLHWLYDVDRIAEVAERIGGADFIAPDPENYNGARGTFVHGARQVGQSTQYGEVLRLAIQSVGANGFDVDAFTSAYAAHFGPGGAYIGYIDRPTRGTLANIAAKQSPTGIDDDQMPAIATLPAVVAAHGADEARVIAAMEVTNVNPVARRYGMVFARALAAVLDGAPLADTLRAEAPGAPGLTEALDSPERSSVAYGEVTKRACHLPQGMPLAWHILAHHSDYRDAVETNILAGGDSAGRSLIVGSLIGAAQGLEALPDAWLAQLSESAALMAACETLAAS